MGKIIKAIIILGIFIGAPLLAEHISNLVTMGMIMKCVYFVSGLILIHFWKECR